MTNGNKSEPARHVTFSLGSDDLKLVARHRHRLSTEERHLNASEVVRLGLRLLSTQPSSAIEPLLKDLPRFRQGRPPKGRARKR